MRRMIAAAAVCAAGLALTGCKGSAPSSAPTPGPAATSAQPGPTTGRAQTRQATATLAAAVRKLGTTSFQFDGGSGIARVTGAYDPVHRTGTFDGSFGIGAGQALVIGTTLYVKGVAEDPDVWLRIDTTRLAPGNVLSEATDPTVPTGYLALVESARRTGPGQYAGSVDVAKLTRAARSDRGAQELLTLLGNDPDKATFEATVDGAGRLTELSVTVTPKGSTATTTVTTRYHDFGTPVRVSAPPAGTVRDAPQQLYTVLAPTPGSSGSPSPSASR
ncbi:hypothetical protein [Actinocatenispora rupis]|uniref:Lipoprotein LprG n=1 Tax=Actinocatenispora rupis TaxID=519421 RepID=A0A8J3NF27_9ACTN|nr:hypothetical protein [Actinocatenispora rupis]GID13289.1 hypothetical protein Aru02nite_41780 [Actinocatenispora rupis]